jgi:hypothetical protein
VELTQSVAPVKKFTTAESPAGGAAAGSSGWVSIVVMGRG